MGIRDQIQVVLLSKCPRSPLCSFFNQLFLTGSFSDLLRLSFFITCLVLLTFVISISCFFSPLKHIVTISKSIFFFLRILFFLEVDTLISVS